MNLLKSSKISLVFVTIFLASACIILGQANFYYTDATSNKRMTTTDNWSTVPDGISLPASEPGANDNLFFNIDEVNSSTPHLAAGNRTYNSITFRSTGPTQIDGAGFSSSSDRQLNIGSGGITLLENAGPVTIGRTDQRVFMRAHTPAQSIVNNSSSLLTFNFNYAPGGNIPDFTETTITVSGSGSGGVLFSRITDASDKPMALTINTTGLGVTTLGQTSAAFPHNYTGDTLVQSGALRLDGTLSESSVTVGANGVLLGNGTIDNDLHFNAGGSIFFDPSLTLNVGGNVTFDGFGFSNLVDSTGSPLDISTLADGTYTLISGTVDTTNISNLESNPLDLGDGRSAFFQEGSLQMVVIPEPATVSLISGMLIITLAIVRQRRLK